jgi:predicted dehydrogenase
LITAPGPTDGTRFAVGTPTTITALIEFASGATVVAGMSWDVFRHGNHPIELHGTEGSLRLPDPDTFGGTVAISRRGAPWDELSTSAELHGRLNWPYDAPDRANYRMIGVADLAQALKDGRPVRASGALALHVLEVLEGMLDASVSGAAVDLPIRDVRPAALAEPEAAALGG